MLFTDGPGLAEPLAMRRSGEDYFYHADGLGSVVALTDSDGNVVETYQYAAFGRATIKDGSGNTIGSSAVGNPLMFTGTEHDGETGFYHMGFRYLDPDTGRWTQEDPIRLSGGDVNLFAYVSNNPILRRDSLGLLSDDVVDRVVRGQDRSSNEAFWRAGLDVAANFSAGFGDALSGGLTEAIRDEWSDIGYGDDVDKCSGVYATGEYAANAWSLYMSMGGIARVQNLYLPHAVNHNRWARIGMGKNLQGGWSPMLRIGPSPWNKKVWFGHIPLP